MAAIRVASATDADPVQRLFELSVDMLGTATMDGYFTRLNPAWERTLGWSLAELMAEPLLAFVHPDDVAATARIQAPEEQSTFAFQNRLRTRGGDYRLIDWTGVVENGVMHFAAKDITAASTARDEAEAGVRRSDELHRILTANLPDTTVFLLDHDLRILIADGEAIRRLPWFDEALFRDRLVAELDGMVPADVLELSLSTYRAALQGERGGFEFVSEGLTFSVQAVPVLGDDDAVESVLVVARDVTERTQAQQQIERHARQQKAVAELSRFALESQDLGALMAQAMTTATTTLGVDGGGILALSDDAEKFTIVAGAGMPDGTVGAYEIPVGESANAGYTLETSEPTIVEDMAAETRFKPAPFLLELGVVSSVSVPIRGHGRPFGVLDVQARAQRGFTQDDVAFLSAIATLIAVAVERHRDEQTTRHAALHDPLTDLPNRRLALERLADAVRRHRLEGIDVAVLVLDIDRFKVVNDASGHAAGDDVLRALAARLSADARPADTVARLSGDRFIGICPGVDGARGAVAVADGLAAAVSRPLELASGEHSFTVSIGIALAGAGRDTPESLLGDADAAMYRAKARGRGRSELFDAAMRTQAVARASIETELRRALDRGELKAWYQPVIDLGTGRPVSTEALVRWEHPTRGLVSPLEFIGVAEEAGLIAELGLQVLDQACRQTAAWQQELGAELGVSVNVSGRQVNDPTFPAQVAAIAKRSGLRAGTLALEITESVLMEEADSPATVLSTFQEHGLTLALDDFGTGYSSLSRLKRFQLNVLKIDRSFVDGVDSDANDRAIVKATIDMAHAIGLTVVAEGVETRAQEQQLCAFGCDRGQGYLYARPQPAQAITELLRAASR